MRTSIPFRQCWNFYPRSPCGERHTWARGSRVTYVISIHALLAESDPSIVACDLGGEISIHALLAESDALTALNVCCRRGFLSTLSLRRATCRVPAGRRPLQHFYPRSPCGERLIGPQCVTSFNGFLSTLSLRRATAPRVATLFWRCYFYPRSPCGERLTALLTPLIKKPDSLLEVLFLSTLSLRRATNSSYGALEGASISIHALLAESDAENSVRCPRCILISIHALLAESDPPRGGSCYLDNIISIHALLAESDVIKISFLFRLPKISIHALLAESDSMGSVRGCLFCISIHALLAESDYRYVDR